MTWRRALSNTEGNIWASWMYWVDVENIEPIRPWRWQDGNLGWHEHHFWTITNTIFCMPWQEKVGKHATGNLNNSIITVLMLTMAKGYGSVFPEGNPLKV